MTRSTGRQATIEQKLGRANNLPNGDNERPYGRCYGQVCGVSYPCTQREYIDPKKAALEECKAANKAAYEKAKHRTPHNAVAIRCVETGEEWPSKRAAAESIGVGIDLLSYRVSRGDDIDGRHYEEVR